MVVLQLGFKFKAMQLLIQNNSVCGHFYQRSIYTETETFVCPLCSANSSCAAVIKEGSFFCLSGFFTWFLVQQPLLQILE